jgi:carbamoyl-phosphate synthase large subunit
MTIRVAVTGVSGDVGLGAIKGLRTFETNGEAVWILGLDANSNCAGHYLCDHFIEMPRVSDATYVGRLLDALRSNDIDVLLPGIDSEIAVLSGARGAFATVGAQVVLAPPELVEAADDKLLTSAYLSSHGVPVPQTCLPLEGFALKFPLIAKPRRGHGSRGIEVIQTASHLESFLRVIPADYCVQQFVEGPEFTVGYLYDRHGVLQDLIAMERILRDGRTVHGRVVTDAALLRRLTEIGARIPGIGAINLQFRVDTSIGLQVFEINARLSGSTGMRVAVGFNDPLRLVRHFARGTPMTRATIVPATVCRYMTEIVVP